MSPGLRADISDRAVANPDIARMGVFITYCAIAIAALSSLLWRVYMDRFWVHGRGTDIRLDGGIDFNPGPGSGTWVWTPIIEYQRVGRISEMQSAMPKLPTCGGLRRSLSSGRPLRAGPVGLIRPAR